MSKRVCPWWLGYLLASPLRRLVSGDPNKLLAPYVRAGMTVLEPGPGIGFFTLELACLAGPSGRVIVVDIQPRMLSGLKRRAARAGLLDRIDFRLASSESMKLSDVAGQVDFTLAFAVVHEMPSAASFFEQAAAASKTSAHMLLAEPAGHVNAEKFDAELAVASDTGFVVVDRPTVRHSRSALLRKEQ